LNSRCDRSSPSSCLGRKRACHRGLKERKRGIEKCQVAQQKKDDIKVKFVEDRAQIQKEKEQLLAEQIGVKEVVTRALRSVTG
jgi:hypothetical protein